MQSLIVNDNNWLLFWIPVAHLPRDDNNADICPLLQVAVASALSQWPVSVPGLCRRSGARAQGATSAGSQAQPTTRVCCVPGPSSRASSEWERERREIVRTGERGAGTQLLARVSSYLPGTARRRRGPPGSVPRNRASSSQLSWPQDSKNGCADGWTKIWPVLQISN